MLTVHAPLGLRVRHTFTGLTGTLVSIFGRSARGYGDCAIRPDVDSWAARFTGPAPEHSTPTALQNLSPIVDDDSSIVVGDYLVVLQDRPWSADLSKGDLVQVLDVIPGWAIIVSDPFGKTDEVEYPFEVRWHLAAYEDARGTAYAKCAIDPEIVERVA